MSAQEPIQFARRARRKSDLVDHATQILVFGAITGGLIVYQFLAYFGASIGLGKRWSMMLACAVGLGCLLSLAIHEGRSSFRLKANPDREPDNLARLCCVGLPADLRKCGEFPDVPFGPLIFTGWFTYRLSPFMKVIVAILTLPAFSVAHLMIAGATNPWTLSDFVFKAWLALMTARMIVAWLWPTYFRVVPGRLDIMCFSTLRARAISTERFDLRKAKIVVDLRRNVVFLDEGERTAELAIGLMFGRTRFAHALFWAALSTRLPPPLPEHELLGWHAAR